VSACSGDSDTSGPSATPNVVGLLRACPDLSTSAPVSAVWAGHKERQQSREVPSLPAEKGEDVSPQTAGKDTPTPGTE